MCACACIYHREFAIACDCVRAFACVRLRACVCVRAIACVRLRACLHADLIKTQNACKRTHTQNSNALWVQKLSGCTIRMCNMYAILRLETRLTYLEFTYVNTVQSLETAYFYKLFETYAGADPGLA